MSLTSISPHTRSLPPTSPSLPPCLSSRVGANPRKGQQAAFYPGLFTFDDCAAPAYQQLGRACLAEDPAARPSFPQVQEALQAMQAACMLQGPPSALGASCSGDGDAAAAGAVGGPQQKARPSSSSSSSSSGSSLLGGGGGGGQVDAAAALEADPEF